MVVAPYNAQVRLLRRALEAVGLGGTPVGTVDGFQGREAAPSRPRARPRAPGSPEP